MKISLLVVGKLKEAGLRSAADDYIGRIRRYVRLEEQEVKDDVKLCAAAPKDATIVACEVNGQECSSEGFAKQLERWGSTGKGTVCFIIGGAEGIPKTLSDQADYKLSLSRLTLPHRLARVLLLEQIYRGFTILRGEPYARE